MRCPLHDDVSHMGEEKAADTVDFTMLQNTVPAAGIDSGDKNGVIAGEFLPDFLKGPVKLNLFLDFIQPFNRFPGDGAKPPAVPGIPVNQDRSSRRVQFEIEFVAVIGKKRIQECVNNSKRDKNQRAFHLVPGKTDCKINQPDCKELGKELGKHQGPDPGISEEIGVIGTVEQDYHSGESSRDQKIVAVAHIHSHRELIVPEQEPCPVVQKNGAKKMSCLDQEHFILHFISGLFPHKTPQFLL